MLPSNVRLQFSDIQRTTDRLRCHLLGSLLSVQGKLELSKLVSYSVIISACDLSPALSKLLHWWSSCVCAAMASVAGKKRCHLTLEKKVEVIKKSKSDPSLSVGALGEIFGCGKTQISTILKSKKSIITLYESNASSLLARRKPRTSEYSDINDALYKWYLLACSKNIYPDGPQSQKAKDIAVQLKKPGFKGTNEWLEKWKKRYNIRQVTIQGESGDVSGVTIQSLLEILKEYRKEDIYILDETGCFWRDLPEKGFGEKGEECHGGKKSKQRVTIAFLVNAAGSKEAPVVIWKFENPTGEVF